MERIARRCAIVRAPHADEALESQENLPSMHHIITAWMLTSLALGFVLAFTLHH
jgi:hypothetical protein